MQSDLYNNNELDINLREEVLRYVSFWPYLIILILIALLTSFIYLRYATSYYETVAVIEILDESQDSEMALPTELTVFNRSMINLENEINILNSFNIHSKVAKELKSNLLYYDVGSVKSSLTTRDKWFDDYQLDFKINTNLIEATVSYNITIEDNKLLIEEFDSSLNSSTIYKFDSTSTSDNQHNLPFDLSINAEKNISLTKSLTIVTIESITDEFRKKLVITPLGDDSDQLSISMLHENYEIAEEYLRGLLKAFDNDGIFDRQLEYERTIEFVNKREVILKKELESVELRKQSFKQSNNISNLSVDADNNIDLKFNYNSEIFESESQKTIANYLLETIEQNEYDYLPLNIGLENFDLNNFISNYNLIVSEKNKYLSEAGPNNVLVKSLQSQLDNLIENITISINNYLESIEIKIEKLKSKELEFDNIYNKVPQNEKTLRSIERELSIKEALYLLLLQKREEAAINLAVVKPTIKIIDNPISNLIPKSPQPKLIYFSALVSSILIYFIALYLWFMFDNKVHNKSQLQKLLNEHIPIIGEIPFIKDFESNKNDSTPRSVIAESIRMVLSNLKFSASISSNSSNYSQTIIFTSSIKGEGKTLASVKTASALAYDLKKDKKVILVGTDLRNPQIHKNFGVEKNQKGISEILYNNAHKNYKDYVQTFDNLDVLFSGAIPPNPTSLLSSDNFKDLILLLKKDYDYVIIDSAPCLLVSDTFQFIEMADSVVFMFRANFTDSKIVDFINETYSSKNIKNFNVVINAVGNSSSYGYKYGYQYGYKYGYKYGYNYGYGYGYSSDS